MNMGSPLACSAPSCAHPTGLLDCGEPCGEPPPRVKVDPDPPECGEPCGEPRVMVEPPPELTRPMGMPISCSVMSEPPPRVMSEPPPVEVRCWRGGQPCRSASRLPWIESWGGGKGGQIMGEETGGRVIMGEEAGGRVIMGVEAGGRVIMGEEAGDESSWGKKQGDKSSWG